MKKKYAYYIMLVLILILAGFLRLYRIEDYMTFLGDEGRDALVVKRMIIDHEFTLLGPITSVGLMHLGPAYYYFMAPFLLLSNLNPVGPSIMVALFSLMTIVLIWRVGKEFLDEGTGLIAAFFYATSPLVIIHSHSSWNPNILPFWALLLMYSLLKVVVQNKYSWLLLTGLCLGIVLQLHYVALVFILITLGCIVLMKFKLPFKAYILGISGALVTFSPFLVFELRHSFINTQTIYRFVMRSGEAKTFGVGEIIFKMWDLLIRLYWRVVVVENVNFAKILVVVTIGSFIFMYIKRKSFPILSKVYAVFAIWLFGGIALLSFYTGSVYDYYLMFVFPLPFLLMGYVFRKIITIKYVSVAVLVAMLYLTFIHMKHTAIAQEPNRLMYQTKVVAEFILEKVNDKPYNFALITPGNSDHAYRYFLDINGHAPISIKNEVLDPERKTVTDQLIVVCEQEICKPLGHPLWEIAGFGRAEITDEWVVGLHKIVRLDHYVGEE